MKMTEENNAVKPNVTEDDVRLLIKRKDDIEEQIKAYHDMLQTRHFVERVLCSATNGVDLNAAAKMEVTEPAVSLPAPFALVDAVTQGSPAFQAGLRVGDEILEFGSINTHNFRNLRDVASVVQHSEGKSLRVGVIRSGQEVHLNLTPKQWSGRGLLGCNLVPLHR
uniref:26S proteasome non-ATPase regulatory subunit 9 n=1 Tax=Cyprinus carpio TaxID=7962 RepID=A0A8C2KE86_CYPCA